MSKLEEMEFCSLSVEDKLEVLVALVDRILNSYSVADHMEKKIDESKAAWRHRIKVLVEEAMTDETRNINKLMIQ